MLIKNKFTLLVIIGLMSSLYAKGMTYTFLDSLTLEKVNIQANKNSRNQRLIFFLDFNDCFNCNLLINNIIQSKVIKSSEINLVLNGIPKFKIKDFIKEYKISSQINILDDAEIVAALSLEITKAKISGISSFLNVYPNGYTHIWSIKEFGNSGKIANLIQEFKLDSTKHLLNDNGYFFTGIGKLKGRQQDFFLLTHPNMQVLHYDSQANLIGKLMLNDTLIIQSALVNFSYKYADTTLAKPINSITGILTSFENEIKPLGFNLISFSTIEPLGNDLYCILYVRMPIETSKSEVNLDNAILLCVLDENLKIKTLLPIEIPKLKDFAIQDNNGICFQPNGNLFISLLPLNNKKNPNSLIGEWKLEGNRYHFKKLIDLSLLDTNFSNDYKLLYHKPIPQSGFSQLGNHLKISTTTVSFNLSRQNFEFDNCNPNGNKIYRELVGKISSQGKNQFIYIEYLSGKIFRTIYNEDNLLIASHSVDLDIHTKGLKFVYFNNDLYCVKPTETGFELNLLLLH